MARRKCPGCGARYDGRRCPECFYAPFDAEEISRPHSWELRSTPAGRKQPQQAYRPVQRRSTVDRRAVTVVAVSAAIIFLSVFVGILVAATRSVVSDMSSSLMQPETIVLPEDGLTLYDADGVRVILDWSGGEITGDIPVYLENNSERDVTACTAGVAVNGCMNDDVFFYADARSGMVSMSQLWIDTGELQDLGIGTVGEITLQVEIIDEDSYEVLNDRETVTFGPGGASLDMDGSGEAVFDSDGIRLVWQGVQTDEWGGIWLRFYAENNTGKTLDLSSSELTVNGQESGQYLWQSFFPDTKAVIQAELYQASSLGVTEPGDLETLEFSISATVDENWENEIISDTIVLRPDGD